MDYAQVLKTACVHAREAAYKNELEKHKLAGALKGIDIARAADDVAHLANLLSVEDCTDYIVMKEHESGVATIEEYWEQHYCTIYLKLVADVIRIWQHLNNQPVSPAAIRTYAIIVGGNRE